jgi:hypothetical protein
MPLRLPLGENAVTRMGDRLRERLDDLERVAGLARSVDYPRGSGAP